MFILSREVTNKISGMSINFRENLNLQHNRSVASIALHFRDYLIKIKTLKTRISSIWVLYKLNAQENSTLHLWSTLSTDTCPHESFWNIKADVLSSHTACNFRLNQRELFCSAALNAEVRWYQVLL